MALTDLTPPAERLPAGCALVRNPAEPSLRGLPDTAPPAPWIGSEPSRLVAIRRVIIGPPGVPDAAPIDRPERFWVRLAEGVEEGYQAFYGSGANRTVVTVAAVRYRGSEQIDAPPPGRRTAGRAEYRLTAGRVVALVRGPAGACFAARGGDLKALEP